MESTLQMLKQLFQLKNTPKNTFSQRHKKTLLLCALIGSLQACGGGGGSKAVTTPTVPKSYAFSLTSTLTNKCGEKLPFVDVELFIQNSDWSVVEKLQPDASGVFNFSSDSELINYTIAAKTQQTGKAEGLDFVSFNQVKATTAAIYQAQHAGKIDNTNCECVTNNVEVSHAPISNIAKVTSSANFTDTEIINSQNTHFNNVEVCRIVDGSWPTHSFSIVGIGNNSNVLGAAGFIEDFSQTIMNNDSEEVWELAAFDGIEEINLNNGHQAFTTHQSFLGLEHFAINVTENDNMVDLFNSHVYVSETDYQSNAEVVFTEVDSAFGSIKISSQHQVISSVSATSFAVKASDVKPNVDDVFFSEINSDWSYDYSDVADYPMAIITVNYQGFEPIANTPMPVTWKSYGEITGQLPVTTALEGYDDIINDDTLILGTNTILVQSQSTNNYANYLLYYQNASNSTFVNNIKSYHISIEK
jgi:hypothetical protein